MSQDVRVRFPPRVQEKLQQLVEAFLLGFNYLKNLISTNKFILQLKRVLLFISSYKTIIIFDFLLRIKKAKEISIIYCYKLFLLKKYKPLFYLI